MDIEKVRSDSTVCDNYAYFDTAAASAPTKANIDAVMAYLEKTLELGIYNPGFRKDTYAKVTEIRGRVADFIGCDRNELAFVKNATEGISIVAQGMDLSAGDEVIVAEFENLSNLMPWLRLEKMRGIKVVKAKANPDGLIDTQMLEDLITPKTRLISFSQLPNATGAVQPAGEICAIARERGVKTLVCAAQSFGMLPIDVRELGCDFLTACGRKAMRALEGSGILFVRRELIETLEPCLVGWWNSSFDFESGEVSLSSDARRFEAGCPIVPAIISLGEAVEYADRIGIDNISNRVKDMTVFAISELERIEGIKIYGPKDSSHRIGIIPFNVSGIDPYEIVDNLERHGIIIEAGHFMAHSIMQQNNIEAMARMSLHYFNDEGEIRRAVSLVKSMVDDN